MKTRNAAVAVGLAMALASGYAEAATIVNVSGSIQGHAFSARLDLNVVGNQAVSGSGTFTGYGLVNNDLTLITADTPYNEPTVYGPIGFRGNDGTDFLGLDQNYPIDGLLFDIGTPAAPNAFPLFAVYTNNDGSYGAGFTGQVDGTEYYFQLSNTDDAVSVSVGTVPLPASAPLFGAALTAFGVFGYSFRRKRSGMA